MNISVFKKLDSLGICSYSINRKTGNNGIYNNNGKRVGTVQRVSIVGGNENIVKTECLLNKTVCVGDCMYSKRKYIGTVSYLVGSCRKDVRGVITKRLNFINEDVPDKKDLIDFPHQIWITK